MDLLILENLGKGSYGTVFKVKDEKKNKVFAVKIIKPDKLRYIELDILSRLRCPYLVRSFGSPIVETSKGAGICMNIVEKNIKKLNFKQLDYDNIKRIIATVIYGLKCMHSKGFIHLDIAMRNILFDYNKKGKIIGFLADFGFSVRSTNAYKGIKCNKYVLNTTVPYEVLKCLIEKEKYFKYNDKSDIWSMGILILEMLGTKFPPLRKSSQSCIEEYYDFLNNIDEKFIEERIKMFNYNNKLGSVKEQLYLKELLLNMLKKDKKDRISSKNIDELSFFKDLNLDDNCVLEKPEELLTIPYTSEKTYQGLIKINKFYKKNSSKYLLAEYFLAIQMFLRIMSKTTDKIDEGDLEYIIKKTINSSLNYYGKKETDFYVAKILDGQVGYNPYYYSSKYLEDLIILNSMIMEDNQYIISSLNVLNPKELFEFFRQKYDYKKLSKNKVGLDKFFQMEIPEIKENYINNKITIDDYFDLNEEESDLFDKQKKTENSFRKMLIEKIKDRILKEKDIVDPFQILEDIRNGKKINSSDIKQKKFIEIFKNIVGYQILNSDLRDINQDYLIYKYLNKSSLLHADKEKKIITHYYSDYDKNVKKIVENLGYKYTNNYTSGTGFCNCKIFEACLIFIIYYNKYNLVKNFDFKCLENKTLETMLMFMFL
tara:strand:- start:338 stop:2302 length:1965 start_codon:yes stop_codon:yes gene_type:complete